MLWYRGVLVLLIPDHENLFELVDLLLFLSLWLIALIVSARYLVGCGLLLLHPIWLMVCGPRVGRGRGWLHLLTWFLFLVY